MLAKLKRKFRGPSPRFFEAIQRGSECLASGSNAEAVTWAESALDEDPGSAAALHLLGQACLAQGDNERAAVVLEKAATLSGSPDVYHQLGQALIRLKRFEAAESAFRVVVKSDAARIGSLIELGRALLLQNKLEEAEQHLKNAIELNPASSEAHFNLARVWQRRGLHRPAAEEFEQVLKIVPTHAAAALSLAKTYLELGEPNRSELRLREFLHLAPDNIDGRVLQVRLCAELGRAEEAIIALEKLLESRWDEKTALELAALYLKENRGEEGEALARRVIEHASEPDFCVRALRLLSRAYQMQGSPEKALEAIEEAVALTPKDENLLLHRVKLLRLPEVNRLRDALSAVQTLIELNPENVENYCNLALIAKQLGENELLAETVEAALHVLERQQKNTNKDLSAEQLGKKAYLFEVAGRITEALSAYQEALTAAPDNARFRAKLAKLYRNCGEYTAAYRVLTEGEKLGSRNSETEEIRTLLSGDLTVYSENFLPSVSVEPRPANNEVRKVLHVLETSFPHRLSGYSVRSHYILQSQTGCDLSVAAITRPGFPRDCAVSDYQEQDVVEGIPYHRISISGHANYNRQPLDKYLQLYAEQVANTALNTGADLIHAASNFKNGIAAHGAAKALGLPWVYELRGLWEDTQVSKNAITEDSERYRFFREREEACLRDANAVVTISETLRKEIINRGIADDKVFVVPNAVDIEKFPVLTRDEALAQELGLGEGPVLGYISSLVAYEGIEVLLQAFSRLRESNPEAKLLIVGDGDERGNLESLARDLNLGESAIFTGRVPHDQVLKYYSLIDVFVVPRLPLRVCQIVTPLKPYEAMSTGRALVVSDVDALREMVIEGETGRVFTAGDPEDLARVCRELCANVEERKRLAENAAKWVRRERSWENVVRTYIDAYRFAKSEQGRVR